MGHGTLSIGLVRPRILQKLVLYVMMVVLRMVDWHLNTFWTWLQLRIFLPFQEHAAHDQLPVIQGVAACRLLYGTEWYERVNVVYPSSDPNYWRAGTTVSTTHFNLQESDVIPKDCVTPGRIPVLYIHGGGFVAANSSVLLQSITPLARAGFTVFAIDYPKVPSYKFPTPVLPTLKAMKWIKQTFQQEAIQVYGDSAGASISVVATALACNPSLLKDFTAATQRAECPTSAIASDLPRI